MPEPISETLSRFTPNAGGLDRDALLIAAGRASARTNRGWRWLAACLGTTQMLTLILLWPRPSIPPVPLARHASPPHVVPKALDEFEQSPEPRWGERVLAAYDVELPPASASAVVVPADPPLHALAASSLAEIH